jgi:hypothetical protein
VDDAAISIDRRQLAGRPRRIGTLKGRPVVELSTKGGLTMVVHATPGRPVTLGTGPHRAVARHIAKKREPEISFNLEKSDDAPLSAYEHLLPRYEALTADLRRFALG